ncbi:hypothetical protein HK103_007562 [Boothiomyces macroporosus]|uniref:Uncharacterized protein n=1 Tax=Boothiomyces macroporosus TaxID=261099 RepID=A0AAD5UFR5_9FUNG|nr:hypothetical protein HK103_007562 [Boothiomyces macroporosus]
MSNATLVVTNVPAATLAPTTAAKPPVSVVDPKPTANTAAPVILTTVTSLKLNTPSQTANSIFPTNSNENVLSNSPPTATGTVQKSSNPINFTSPGFIIAYVLLGLFVVLALIITAICKHRRPKGQSLSELFNETSIPYVQDKKMPEPNSYRPDLQNRDIVPQSGPQADQSPFENRPVSAQTQPASYSLYQQPDSNRYSMMSSYSNYSNAQWNFPGQPNRHALFQPSHIQANRQEMYQQIEPQPNRQEMYQQIEPQPNRQDVYQQFEPQPNRQEMYQQIEPQPPLLNPYSQPKAGPDGNNQVDNDQVHLPVLGPVAELPLKK